MAHERVASPGHRPHRPVGEDQDAAQLRPARLPARHLHRRVGLHITYFDDVDKPRRRRIAEDDGDPRR